MATVPTSTPGVQWQGISAPAPSELLTGVPAFLGYAGEGAGKTAVLLTNWPQFEKVFGAAVPGGYLAVAVRSFFENGGDRCYVASLAGKPGSPAATGLEDGLKALTGLDAVDLVCCPDATAEPKAAPELQQKVLDYCTASGGRFAILDALPGSDAADVLAQRHQLHGVNGALYFPWVLAPGAASAGRASVVAAAPPCGHVAGVYTRSDRATGVHKAPANEVLEGVLDLQVLLSDADQGQLNMEGVNCLRAFPGRGIRVWGARTLSDDPAWRYVNVRRLFLTVGRWIERNLASVAWEPHDTALWARVTRDVTAYLDDLYRRGALAGRTPQEAYYVKCDAETNPPGERDAGRVITEIGLAPARPAEFIKVRVTHQASGVSLAAAAG